MSGTVTRPTRAVPLSLLAIAIGLAGCSVYMEATRPTPVDLSKFQPGQERKAVVEQLGTPVITEAQPDGDSCDLYELFVTGHGTARKVATMLVEGATDVVMPAAELLWSPTQAVTRDQKHPVWFCYQDQKIVSVGLKPPPSASPTRSLTATPVTSQTQASPART